MSNEVTTTTSSFPVNDVTHRPKRKQSSVASTTINTVEVQKVESTDIPTVLTKERVIKFFKENANGSLSDLYLTTAEWLQESLQSKSSNSGSSSLEEVLND